MNVRLVRKNEIIPDAGATQALASACGVHPRLAQLLISRGVDSPDKVAKFLHPKAADLYDPFEMKGMREAVDRLELAVKEGQSVVVYGDYDADGICAAAILSLYLSARGLNVYVHIPNRTGDGYGLNTDSLDKIIEECCPDLILTCDCGISGHDEVAYALDLGVDVIVTDHHEVSDTLPECVVVNPKQTDCNYPYAYLCGAGVAFKLVQAMGGTDAAMQYVDLAAVATIADLVPLTDENRLLVQLGLKALEDKRNLGLRLLIEDQKLTYPVQSGDVAYKIAPRINAAGRMGDAYRSFELLTCGDGERVAEILREINEDNQKRKQLCDKLYDEALIDLEHEDVVSARSIILSNPNWEKGITGILAARLAGDFNRPAFVMVNAGETYKGTSRSIEGINVYELLSSVSDLLVEFGGHSQAAGFSIQKDDIPAFRRRVNEYLAQFDADLFAPTVGYDAELDEHEIDLSLVRSLELLEPTGNSNPRPLFKTTVGKLQVAPFKSNHAHTNIICENGLQIVAFNYYKQNQFLLGEDSKDLALELQLNDFGGKESPKAFLRAVSPSKLYINDTVAKACYLKSLAYGIGEQSDFLSYAPNELAALIGDRRYGVLAIAGCERTYREFCNRIHAELMHEFLYFTCLNNYSRVIVSPDLSGAMLSGYDRIVFLDTPPGYALAAALAKKSGAKVYVPQTDNQAVFYEGVDCSREAFGQVFDAIRRNRSLAADNILSYYKLFSSRAPVSMNQFMACVTVFTSLGLLSVQKSPYSIGVNDGVRASLTDAQVYGYLAKWASK